MMVFDKLLTVQEAADLLYVCSNTVRKWDNQGLIKSFRIGPRKDRRFKEKDVVLFLKNNIDYSRIEREVLHDE